MLERVGLYVPQQDWEILDHLTRLAAQYGWPVHQIIGCWQDVLQALAGRDVDLVLATSLSDFPPERRPRIVFADELPPSPTLRRRPHWRR